MCNLCIASIDADAVVVMKNKNLIRQSVCINFSHKCVGEDQNEGAHRFNPDSIINESESEDDETSASKLLRQVSCNRCSSNLWLE